VNLDVDLAYRSKAFSISEFKQDPLMTSSQHVIVTGAAGALGRAVTQHFLDQGATVHALDLSLELLKGALADLSSEQLQLYAVDLTRRDDVARCVAEVIAPGGQIDVLCNIAGGFMMGDSVADTTDDTWDFLFNLNTKTVMYMASAVVPVMRKQGSGKIVNVGALAAREGLAQMGVYIASKSATIRLTESLSAELKPQGINVNCVLPAVIDTPRNRADMPDADFDAWVPPSQLAAVIGFLASEAAAAVHGAAIPVTGRG
jgi:NAD(P)-dependent dehydrogenase (short-subunit alcohol dehydrogenase family)